MWLMDACGLLIIIQDHNLFLGKSVMTLLSYKTVLDMSADWLIFSAVRLPNFHLYMCKTGYVLDEHLHMHIL